MLSDLDSRLAFSRNFIRNTAEVSSDAVDSTADATDLSSDAVDLSLRSISVSLGTFLAIGL